MLLTSTAGEVMEVIVAGGMILLVMTAMAAIPLLVQYYIEERQAQEE